MRLNSNGTVANDGLTHLPAGLFDRLTGLTALLLHDNDLSSLPPRIFEKLTNLAAGGLSLSGNPGSARFVPTAKAGPAGGFDVVSGGSVTLGDAGAVNGYDDPWGTNVTYAWAPDRGHDRDLYGRHERELAAPGLHRAGGGRGRDACVPPDGHRRRRRYRHLQPTSPSGWRRGRRWPGWRSRRSRAVWRRRYRGGETIEVALRFDRAVTVDTAGGTPSVALTVGAAPREARYLRGCCRPVRARGC